MEHLTEACWDGYKQVGMKDKGGKMVPNCVPVEEGMKDIVKDLKNFGRIQTATMGRQPGDAAELRAKINALIAKNKAKKDAEKAAIAKESYDEIDEYCPRCLMEYIVRKQMGPLEEAEYQGRKVSLGKPFRTSGGPKKFSVYVKNNKGNVIKVNFGDPNMRIKKNIPGRRKNFRARHRCHTAKDRTSARYWSCRAW
jgi:hypothetical protein